MFARRVRLFKLFGFEVKIDSSWIIIAFLIVWSLAEGLFPRYYHGLPAATYWAMGIAGAVGLFLSIIFHELWHSLIARKFGLSMKGITLFIFGGVAEMEDEPPSAKAEFFMAIAGPVSSVVLGFVFYTAYIISENLRLPISFSAVAGYLKWINWVLAGFNLLPAFPLDGGRVFRSFLWYWKGNLKWATRISSRVGSGFGLLLSLIGILYIFTGAFINGIWWLLIGMFLNSAARMSYEKVLMKSALEGEPVRNFMVKDPVTVPADISIKELVEDYVYHYHFKMFPVVEKGKFIGCISTRQIKEIPKSEWFRYKVAEFLVPCSVANTISPDTDATEALSIMNKTGNSRLIVIGRDNQLAGVVTLKDLLRFFSLKLDLEGENFTK